MQQLISPAAVHASLVGVKERLFFRLLNQTARSTQALDVNLSAEMMLFPRVKPLRDGGGEVVGGLEVRISYPFSVGRVYFALFIRKMLRDAAEAS